MLTGQQIRDFQDGVWDYFRAHRRDMPWRDAPTPYHVLVSELMLQQTQVGRVLPKYHEFMRRFPDIEALALASLADVLAVWNGLGYNRRAKFLHDSVRSVVRDHGAVLPSTMDALVRLPGIGKNTAGAILAYAYNQPVVFIETNIRSVFFYHFFADATDIDDKELAPLVEQTLDREHPRQWYWALMDYGVHLKQTAGNNIVYSRHYSRQSAFEGSRRQIRGQVVRLLVQKAWSRGALVESILDERLESVIDDLVREGLVVSSDGQLRLTGQAKLP